MRIFLAILLMVFVGCSSIDIETIEQRPNGLTYYKGTDRLVNGIVTRRFEDGGLAEKANYTSGKQVGKWFTYDYQGNDFTHGYGIELDQQIINDNRKMNLANVTLSINVEKDYQYASIALPDITPNTAFGQVLQLRNSIYDQYSKQHHFKDVFIFYRSTEYRFTNAQYSGNICLDTTLSNDDIIINVR